MEILASLFSAPLVQLGIAGGSGGIARWLFLLLTDRRLPTDQALATVGLGLIMGIFAAPPVTPGIGTLMSSWLHLQVEAERLPQFSAFVVGATAVMLMGIVYDFLKSRKKELRKDAGVDPVPPKPAGDAR